MYSAGMILPKQPKPVAKMEGRRLGKRGETTNQAGAWMLALLGCALCFMLVIDALFAADQWPVTGRLNLPLTELLDTPPRDVFGLAIAFMAPALLPLMAMAMRCARRRETLAGYIVVCGLLPLPLMLLPGMDGVPLLMALAGMATGAFWWFAFRRPRVLNVDNGRAHKVSWLILVLCLILTGIIALSAHIKHLQREAEQNAPVTGPQIWGGVALGSTLLLYDADGNLSAWDRQRWTHHALPISGVVDVKSVDRSSAWLLSAPPLPETLKYGDKLPAGHFTLSLYHAGAIETLPPVAYGVNERPRALAALHGDPLVIDDAFIHLFDHANMQWHHRRLNAVGEHGLPPGAPSTVVSNDGRTLYAGFNGGEFGGGIVTIDLATGHAARLEDRRGPACARAPSMATVIR